MNVVPLAPLRRARTLERRARTAAECGKAYHYLGPAAWRELLRRRGCECDAAGVVGHRDDWDEWMEDRQ